MNVFICWSGPASLKLAEGLRDWLPRVIQETRPFLSTADISKGDRWLAELNSKLEGTNYGVLCMTPDNLLAPWILFEAGALSKNTESGRVSALMLGVKQSDLAAPLGQFQHTEPNAEDMLELARSINKALVPERRLQDSLLEPVFQAHWPFFEGVIAEARDVLKQAKQEKPPPRPTQEMFEEIIGMLRDIQRTRVEGVPLSSLLGYGRVTGPTGPIYTTAAGPIGGGPISALEPSDQLTITPQTAQLTINPNATIRLSELLKVTKDDGTLR